MKSMKPERIIISRTDNIGDVVLCLPVAGVLKKQFPECKIIFLGNSYTQAIIESCEFVDEFIDGKLIIQAEEKSAVNVLKNLRADVIIHVFPNKKLAVLAKKAKIPLRIATTNRSFHWGKCNKLIRLSRKRSLCHEAQLNLKLLTPLGVKELFSLGEIPTYFGLNKIKPLRNELKKLLQPDKFNLILHPKSKGSAREWGLDHFAELIDLLPADKFRIFISGTKEEGIAMKEFIGQHPSVVDITGKCSLPEFVSFIANADGMIAASTGPLHIAAAMNKIALGIYAPMRPIFPTRWAPLGKNADYIVLDKKCNDCKKSKECECIRSIQPNEVKEKLLQMISLEK